MPFPTYRDIEAGSSWPERKTLARIAETLGVAEGRLFVDPDAPPTREQILARVTEALDALREPRGKPAETPREPALSPARRELLDALSTWEEDEVELLVKSARIGALPAEQKPRKK